MTETAPGGPAQSTAQTEGALRLAHHAMWRMLSDQRMWVRGVNPSELHGVLTGALSCKDCQSRGALSRTARKERWSK